MWVEYREVDRAGDVFVFPNGWRGRVYDHDAGRMLIDALFQLFRSDEIRDVYVVLDVFAVNESALLLFLRGLAGQVRARAPADKVQTQFPARLAQAAVYGRKMMCVSWTLPLYSLRWNSGLGAPPVRVFALVDVLHVLRTHSLNKEPISRSNCSLGVKPSCLAQILPSRPMTNAVGSESDPKARSRSSRPAPSRIG